MEEAIKRAIEGGYDSRVFINEDGGHIVYKFQSEILLDPLFWQALGKAELKNWGEITFIDRNRGNENSMTTWLYHWHRFLDALAEGKTPDDFFKDLLSGTAL